MKAKFRVATVFASLIYANSLHAIESASITDRYRLVGVIAAADKKGQDASLAVIKDEQTGRSVMVRTGEQLPGADNIRLAVIRRNEIELNANGQNIVVGYGGGEAKSTPSDPVPEYMPAEDLSSYYYEPNSDDSVGTGEIRSFDADAPRDFADAERVPDLSEVPAGVQSSEYFGQPSTDEMDSALRSVPTQEPRIQRNSETMMYNESDSATSPESETSSEVIGTAEESVD